MPTHYLCRRVISPCARRFVSLLTVGRSLRRAVRLVRMCRWVAYSGNAIRPAALLYDTPHSLVEQSRRDRLAGGYPNADGFGLGWYGDLDVPGLYRSVAPAWGDRNLHEIATQISTPIFLAHVRAATGTPVEQTNCHPFRHGRWLFMHNGSRTPAGAPGSTRCCR
jgi:predicted glutamine amidotransferase